MKLESKKEAEAAADDQYSPHTTKLWRTSYRGVCIEEEKSLRYAVSEARSIRQRGSEVKLAPVTSGVPLLTISVKPLAR
jgi:hypothetical protein